MKPEPLDLEDLFKCIERILLTKEEAEQIRKIATTGRITIMLPKTFDKIYLRNDMSWEHTKQEIIQRIKSACEFWLKYCQVPDLLQKDYPEIYARWLDYFTTRIKEEDEERKSYMEWLFKLAFKDVMEDE